VVVLFYSFFYLYIGAPILLEFKMETFPSPVVLTQVEELDEKAAGAIYLSQTLEFLKVVQRFYGNPEYGQTSL